MLWFPNLFCLVLPGGALNVAKVVHSEVAILAASFLFIFHSIPMFAPRSSRWICRP